MPRSRTTGSRLPRSPSTLSPNSPFTPAWFLKGSHHDPLRQSAVVHSNKHPRTQQYLRAHGCLNALETRLLEGCTRLQGSKVTTCVMHRGASGSHVAALRGHERSAISQFRFFLRYCGAEGSEDIDYGRHHPF